MGCIQLGICQISGFQAIGNMSRFPAHQCGEIAENREFSQNEGRKSAFSRHGIVSVKLLNGQILNWVNLARFSAQFRGSRLSGTCEGFQSNTEGKQLKIVIKSYDVIWSITSRHFYGTNMLFVRFWDDWILKGGQISHFSSIFMVRLWLELGYLFQQKMSKKCDFFSFFFGKIGAMPKIPAQSGYLEKNFFLENIPHYLGSKMPKTGLKNINFWLNYSLYATCRWKFKSKC